MTILVAGATGTVGRHIVSQLIAKRYEVRALTRYPDNADLPPGAEIVVGNLADVTTLKSAFIGVDAMHLITFDSGSGTQLATGRLILDIAIKSGVRKVTVLTGSLGESPLEHAAMSSGLEWTLLSPSEFMGNTLEWAESIRNERVVRELIPASPSALIHEADIAAVAVAALTQFGHSERRYFLTGPEALTIPQRIQILAQNLGLSVRCIELTRDESVARWRREGYTEPDIEFFLAMRFAPPEAGYTLSPTVFDVTGCPPRSFAQWVSENSKRFRLDN